jgi:hypothetical protein
MATGANDCGWYPVTPARRRVKAAREEVHTRLGILRMRRLLESGSELDAYVNIVDVVLKLPSGHDIVGRPSQSTMAPR